ncbi:microcystin-dependent protein [Spirosoma oryzae]|uniref:Microcystin-dependent protein n=1 Tax=Spirosoma oryzae TaxID=1469603 RepID=A0A2T0RMM2_9BACT|nr:tail fiber protein [Spirosoma oryzae]PRY22446.1 microcystin-dependent protein [Spirosoma oryzae]
MDPFLGEIRLLPFRAAPRGWALCQGQLLAIRQNTALFSLLGTNYGGDGKTTFALPDLRGRAAVGTGQGAGLSDYSLGEATGVPSVTLLNTEMPMHTHTLLATLNASSSNAGATSPAGGVFAASSNNNEYTEGQGAVSLAADFVSGSSNGAGNGLPHENMMPYLTLNYCIALQGVFPPRP